MRLKAAVIFLSLVIPLEGIQALTLKEVVSHLKEAQTRIQGLKAQLLQERRPPGGATPVVMDGVIWIRKPDRLRMDIFPPHESITVLRGDELLIYFPEEKVAQKVRLSKDPTLARWLKFLQAPVEEIERHGEVEEVIGGKIVIRIEPSDEFDQFKSIRLWIDQKLWLPVKIELEEKTGEHTVITYSGIEVNPTFPEGIFDLKLPQDVEVTELEG